MSIKNKIPWKLKIIAKLILSRIPIKYNFWKQLALFKHGEMDKPNYAYGVFKSHFDKVTFARQNGNFVVLELGPGDSLFSAMIAYAFGASSIYLVDVDDFVSSDMKPYFSMANYLKENGLITPEMDDATSLKRLLKLCNAEYMTDGIGSLKKIPDNSVDFIWSQAVLEHVKLSDFPILLKELRRIIRDDGICSHCIDLRDHLSNSLNHLRFSNRIWESEFMSKSGFYTNRLRFHELVNLFTSAGFSSKVINLEKWDKLPAPKKKLSGKYKAMTDEELSVSVFDVVLKPK